MESIRFHDRTIGFYKQLFNNCWLIDLILIKPSEIVQYVNYEVEKCPLGIDGR